MTNIDSLFDRRLSFPDMDAKQRYSRLVGLDDIKSRLQKILGILVHPESVEAWQESYHPDAELLLDTIVRRPPLIVLAGDVGTGKTELGETVGDTVARQFDINLTLFPMSLSTRGSGRVGEMTQLVSDAFSMVHSEADKLKRGSGSASGGVVLLIDEADALAQSRENAQMHHEDRAGVNALLRGIDRLAESQLPAAVIMCTNRWSAIDPAIQRRACEVVHFSRPNEDQRRFVIDSALRGTGLSQDSIDDLVSITGPREGREYGFTYSDLTQRLLPNIALAAFPDRAITDESALNVAECIVPTPPFFQNVQ